MGGEEKDRSASRTYSGAPTGAEPSSSDSSRGDPRSASRLYVDPGGGSGSSSSRSHHHSSEHGSRRGRRQHQTRVLDSKYQLGEEIGRGSSGKVYRALNRETGDFRAIKEIPTRNMQTGHLEAVQSEIDLLHNLQHDQIVRYFETIRTEGHLYLVLEYVENGSLATLIKNFGAFPEHLVCVYIRQVLRGLEWLHEQGVCHRDIKGANLLITKDGQVKLADFGVARKISETSHQQAAVVGTPYWMAPEVIQMSAFTTASDIWSLGCTILELLNGEPPYYDLKQITALYRIVQDEHPPLPADLTPALRDFLTTCFTRDPERRPTASQLRGHPWLAESSEGGDGNEAPSRLQGLPQRIGQLAVQQVTTLGHRLPRQSSRGEGYDSEGSTSQMEEQRGDLSVSAGSRNNSRQDPSLPPSQHGSRGGSRQEFVSSSRGGSRQESHQSHLSHQSGPHRPVDSRGRESAGRQSSSRQGSREGTSMSPRLGPDSSAVTSNMLLEPPLTPSLFDSRSRGYSGGSEGPRSLDRSRASRNSGGPPQHGRAQQPPPSLIGQRGSTSQGSGSGSGSSIQQPSSLPAAADKRGGGTAPSPATVSSSALAAREREEALRAIEQQTNRRVSRDGRGHQMSGASGDSFQSHESDEALNRAALIARSWPTEHGAAGPPSYAPRSNPSLSPQHRLQSGPSPQLSPHEKHSPHMQRPPAFPGGLPPSTGGLPITADRHDLLRWMVGEESRLHLDPPAHYPPQLQGSSSHELPAGIDPAGYYPLSPGRGISGYSADIEAEHVGLAPYPYSSLRALQSQQQQALDGARQMPLVGFLWKRGSSWRSFAYQRRFFYLTDDALCYIKRPLPANEGAVPTPVTPAGEKRIPLASVTCVRMHSKLKYEFELVCTTRSYRLRAPSAQALALWVTAISSEWLQLRNPPTQQEQPTQQSASQPAAMPPSIPAGAHYGPMAHPSERWSAALSAAPANAPAAAPLPGEESVM